MLKNFSFHSVDDINDFGLTIHRATDRTKRDRQFGVRKTGIESKRILTVLHLIEPKFRNIPPSKLCRLLVNAGYEDLKSPAQIRGVVHKLGLNSLKI